MVYARLKHKAKMLLRPDYKRGFLENECRQAETRRLKALPRYQSAVTDLLGRQIEITDAASFLAMQSELFTNHVYRFDSETDAPVIIDGGANIGLGTIYFKTLYPHCKVTAFEPDTDIYKILRNNLHAFQIYDVTLVNKALWNSETTLTFFSEGADAGTLVSTGTAKRSYSVETVRLRDYISGPVDFLKLDIEGAETEVLADCHDLLGNVKTAFVEYHSFVDRPQNLHSLLQVLRDSGFRVHIHPSGVSPQPLQDIQTYLGMDMQLNIFAYRKE